MRLLADSQVLLWWLGDDPKLSRTAKAAMADSRADLIMSAVSIWELAIKQSVGKLRIDVDLREHALSQGFTELPVTGVHGAAVRDLPFHHKDPFDRLLIAQARIEDLTLVTANRAMSAYDVTLMSATT